MTDPCPDFTKACNSRAELLKLCIYAANVEMSFDKMMVMAQQRNQIAHLPEVVGYEACLLGMRVMHALRNATWHVDERETTLVII